MSQQPKEKVTTKQYPEYEKLDKIHETSNNIGNFLEWLSSAKQISFAKWVKEPQQVPISIFSAKTKEVEFDIFFQINMEIEKWLAEYFNIDLKKLEEEKQAMLKELRQFQEKKQ